MTLATMPKGQDLPNTTGTKTWIIPQATAAYTHSVLMHECITHN